MERGDAAAVVTQQCMKLRHMTMYLKICAAIVLMQISIGTAFAVDDKKTPQPGGLLQGRQKSRRPARRIQRNSAAT